MKDYMDYSEAQKKVIDRYLEATKDNPQDRMPLDKLVGMKSKFPRSKPDKYMVAKCESQYLSDEESEKKKPGRKKRVIDNSYVLDWLRGYEEYHLATNDFYWLDDIVSSICKIAFEGSTRPLSVHLVFDFLSTATNIDKELIMAVCNVQDRQSRKILAAMVLVHQAIEKEFMRMSMEGKQHERRFLFLT